MFGHRTQVYASFWGYDESTVITSGQLPPDGWVSARKQIVKYVANNREAKLRDNKAKQEEEELPRV